MKIQCVCVHLYCASVPLSLQASSPPHQQDTNIKSLFLCVLWPSVRKRASFGTQYESWREGGGPFPILSSSGLFCAHTYPPMWLPPRTNAIVHECTTSKFKTYSSCVKAYSKNQLVDPSVWLECRSKYSTYIVFSNSISGKYKTTWPSRAKREGLQNSMCWY